MRHSRDRPIHRRSLVTRLRREDGIETLEVALIGVLVMIAITIAVPTLGAGIANALESIAGAFTTAGAGIN